MTNKLVVIIKSLKVPQIKKILLYEMKFLLLIYSCLQNPWLGGYRPQIPVHSVICRQLNLLNPPPEQNSWVRHCLRIHYIAQNRSSKQGQCCKSDDPVSPFRWKRSIWRTSTNWKLC